MDLQGYAFCATIALLILAAWLRGVMRERDIYSLALSRIRDIHLRQIKLKEPARPEILSTAQAALWCRCAPEDKPYRDLIQKMAETSSGTFG